jgi:hypothetical protein
MGGESQRLPVDAHTSFAPASGDADGSEAPENDAMWTSRPHRTSVAAEGREGEPGGRERARRRCSAGEGGYSTVLGCRPSRSDASPLPRPLPAPPPPGLSPPLLLARGERSHPAALRAPVPRVLADPTVAVECRVAGDHVEVRLEFILTAPRSSPLGPLQGRDPTSSTTCAGTGAGRPPSPRGARGEVDPSRRHRGGAGRGSSCRRRGHAWRSSTSTTAVASSRGALAAAVGARAVGSSCLLGNFFYVAIVVYQCCHNVLDML